MVVVGVGARRYLSDCETGMVILGLLGVVQSGDTVGREWALGVESLWSVESGSWELCEIERYNR